MINIFCLIALSRYKQFNFNISERCYLKKKNIKQNIRQLDAVIKRVISTRKLDQEGYGEEPRSVCSVTLD